MEGVLCAAKYKSAILGPGWCCFGGTGKALRRHIVRRLSRKLDHGKVEALVGRFVHACVRKDPNINEGDLRASTNLFFLIQDGAVLVLWVKWLSRHIVCSISRERCPRGVHHLASRFV